MVKFDYFSLLYYVVGMDIVWSTYFDDVLHIWFPSHSLFQIPLNKRTINFYGFHYTSIIKYSQQFGYVMILKNQWGNLK